MRLASDNMSTTSFEAFELEITVNYPLHTGDKAVFSMVFRALIVLFSSR